MLDIRRMRKIDLAIAITAIIVLLAGIGLGVAVWQQKRAIRESVPASRAVDTLVAAVRKSPNNMDYRMQLAQALTVAGRDTEAIKQYKEVLKVNKEFVPALSGIGFIALKNKEWKTGEDYFRKVLDILEPKGTKADETQLETAYYYLGNALMEQKKYEEAVGAFKAAIRYRRDASDTYYLLSNCYKELDIPDAQRDALDNALAFDPKMPEANYEYGILELNAGHKASAAEHFRASVDGAPGEPKPLEQLEKFGSAETHLSEAKKLKESNPQKALTEARIAAAVDPRDVEAVLLSATLWEATKKPEDAAKAYRAVLMLDPTNAKAKAGLKRVTDGS